MPRKRKSRVYPKTNKGSGVTRFYGDFRDLGGELEALIAPGEKYATTDRDVAADLAAARVRQLERKRRGRALGAEDGISLQSASVMRLAAARASGKYGPEWLAAGKRMLLRAVRFFYHVQPTLDPRVWKKRNIPKGPRELATIDPLDVDAFVEWLGTLENGRGGQLSQQSQRHHLSALSGVFRWAISKRYLPMVGADGQGSNPVAALLDRPAVPGSSTPLREPPEWALLLEAARLYDPAEEGLAGGARTLDCLYELLAFFLYTGAREDEVRRVRVRDVHLVGHLGPWVDIHGAAKGRARPARDLLRMVPLHPHHLEILRPHVLRMRLERGLDSPLFLGRDGRPFGDWSKALDRLAARCGYEAQEIRSRQFRVAYATHRCTCDDVDADTVRKELGHGDLDMMATVYARAQRRSERMGPEFSYRLERWAHCLEPGRIERAGVPAPSLRAVRAEERTAVVVAFLAAFEGISAPDVARATGVDDAVLNRLRAGQRTGQLPAVYGKTVERMRAALGWRGRGAA